ncbi:hypothetical protein [Streptomyces sp. NPDC047108]|uniref:hypothetical protein n=1 Tax=Streptomyces sp. NPDC047108 TaxID=3155025 RepID=UPI00340D3D76
MTYNILVTHEATLERLGPALSAILGVPAPEVDVADAYGDPDGRNWDALVSCEYTAVRGDLVWSLDVYVQDQAPQHPSEADMAAQLAAWTHAAVLFSAEEEPPSAYWVATPEGRFARARLLVSDEENPVYTVEAVEAPVQQLPAAQVTRIPEVVRELRIATPLTDRIAAQLDAPVPPVVGEQNIPAQGEGSESPTWYARTRLAAWEKLVHHLASGWSGSGWCPSDLYRERLEARDGLEALHGHLPPQSAQALHSALQQLDSIFAAHTVEDTQGLVIRLLLGEKAACASHGWWWFRRPDPLPWSSS